MADAVVLIEEKHGDNCTCKSVVDLSFNLVAASSSCPGDRSPNRPGSAAAKLESLKPQPYPGLGIAITWPAQPANGTPLLTWPMQIHDQETGQPLLGVTGLRIVLGGENWDTEVIQADLTMLVDVDGQPLLGANIKPVRDPDDPERIYSRVFRCYVFEMRIRDDKP